MIKLGVAACLSIFMRPVTCCLSHELAHGGQTIGDEPLARSNGFLSVLGIGSTAPKQENRREIEISETKGSSTRHLCSISMPLTGNSTPLICLMHLMSCDLFLQEIIVRLWKVLLLCFP